MDKWKDIKVVCLVIMAFGLDFSKYFVTDHNINPTFIMVDFMCWFLLCCFFFIFHGILKRKAESELVNENEIVRLKVSFQKEISELQSRLNSYEKSTLDANQLDMDRERIVKKLRTIGGNQHSPMRYKEVLSILGSYFEVISGIIYKTEASSLLYCPVGTFGFDSSLSIPSVESGIGLGGQAILSNEIRVIDSVPLDYFVITSGLGEARPCFLYLLPISIDGIVVGLLELASFKSILIAPIWGELNVEIGIILAKD